MGVEIRTVVLYGIMSSDVSELHTASIAWQNMKTACFCEVFSAICFITPCHRQRQQQAHIFCKYSYTVNVL